MPNMLFSDLCKSPRSPFAKLRLHASAELQQNPPNPQLQQQLNQLQQQYSHLSGPALAAELDYGDADLVSRDKAKQKDAVRKYLIAHVRNDWDFDWPTQTTATAAQEAEHARQLAAGRRAAHHRNHRGGHSENRCETIPLSAVISATSGSHSEDDSAADSDAYSDTGSDAGSDYSTVSEDPDHFQPRAEWLSDMSDEENFGAPLSTATSATSPRLASPFRFDSPDSVGSAITAANAAALARKARIRRALRREAAWNTGLACFTARRDAWTGAHVVRVKPQMASVRSSTSPTSPLSPRRLFRFHSHAKSEVAAPTPATSAATTTAGQALPHTQMHAKPSGSGSQSASPGTMLTTPVTPVISATSATSAPSVPSDSAEARATSPSGFSPLREAMTATTVTTVTTVTTATTNTTHRHSNYAVETMLPLVRPLLPPANPMRAYITPDLYLSLYDKVVLNSLQPSCPINLSDAIRACVSGWKRDGEWPPRTPVMPPAAMAALRRKQERQAEKERERRRKETEKRERERRDREEREKEKEKERRRKEEKEKNKERRRSSVGASPGFGRRMSHLLSGRPAAAAAVAAVTAAGVGASGVAPTADAPGSGAPGGPSDDDGAGRGIRRSLQRVLGLGHHASGSGSGSGEGQA